jgi:hypothetical protein
VLESIDIVNLTDSRIEDIIKPPRELIVSQPIEVAGAWQMWKEKVKCDEISAIESGEDEMRHVSQSRWNQPGTLRIWIRTTQGQVDVCGDILTVLRSGVKPKVQKKIARNNKPCILGVARLNGV